MCRLKVRDVVGGDVEIPEAVEQIPATARSGSTREVVLDSATWGNKRLTNPRVEPGWCE